MEEMSLTGLSSLWNQTEGKIALEVFWFISVSFFYNTDLQHHDMRDSEFINSCIYILTPYADIFIAHWTVPRPMEARNTVC